MFSMLRGVRSPYARWVLLMTMWLSVASCWTAGYAAAPPPLGQKDLAVWRPAAGTWYALHSATGTVTVTPWGVSGDIPVPADYDGDDQMDLAVWRPADGTWYVLHSTTGTATATPWGVSGDIPVPGDYDGDEQTDLAVWRPAEGKWYILNSVTGTATVIPWGVPGDSPVPLDVDVDDAHRVIIPVPPARSRAH